MYNIGVFMTSFDSFSDTSFQLKTEGETITLAMKQGVPSATQATIEWNIPTPALGCGNNGVYSGMVVLLHTKPLNASNIPQDGTVYVADPSANTDTNVGDRIGDAVVIGAFYECDKKGNDLPLTTSFVITDLDPKVAYYVAGYATDCQHRYHSDGQRAYSDSYGHEEGTHFPAEQRISIKTGSETCIIPSDGTGLLPGATYKFDIVVDDTYPKGTNAKIVEIDIDGVDAGTYQDLVDQINIGIAKVDNPPISPVAPDAGQYYWNNETQELFLFDGSNHNELPVMVEPSDPTVTSIGDYWYDPQTKTLSRWNTPSPTGWNVIEYTQSPYNPTSPTCDSYWIDSSVARRWNGTVWCDAITAIQTDDPVDCHVPVCGSWWYDEINMQLGEWDSHLNMWEPRSALYWHEAPNQLSDGTYWFDITTEHLSILNTGSWTDLTANPNVMIQIAEPTSRVDGVLWYSTETEELNLYDGNTGGWIPQQVIGWAVDPSTVDTCDAWWRSTDDELLLWDAIGNDWVIVQNFTVSTADPVFPAEMVIDQVWYNPSTDVVMVWDGSAWIETTNFLISPTDPHTQTLGDGWLDTTTGLWYIYDTPAAGWNAINPVDNIGLPSLIASGTYWYDTSVDTLQVRNGVVWMNVIFSTSPLTPKRGSLWFDTTENVLLVWDGGAYVAKESVASAVFGECGISILSSGTGSSNFVMIPVMNQPSCTASGFADFSAPGVSATTTCGYSTANGITNPYTVRHLTEAGYLWNAIKDAAIVANPIVGADGADSKRSYDQIGVGDDGTPDERRELAYSIRAQLGYPVVEVELTAYQLDTAIQGAIESFRKRSSMAYRRGFYFLDIQPQQQNYFLTNKQIGYNKIVTVSAAYRFTSAFMATSHGGGVYGQLAMQQLYNMGTYDLTSYHLVSQYIETMQDLFATRLVYNFNESTRALGFFQSFTANERVLLDCFIERTEQDLMTDRFAKTWIERYALAEAMTMLARIRGKYGSLPGAGGGVSLDAADLMATAELYRQDLMSQLDDFIVQDMEGVGMNSSFIFGG